MFKYSKKGVTGSDGWAEAKRLSEKLKIAEKSLGLACAELSEYDIDERICKNIIMADCGKCKECLVAHFSNQAKETNSAQSR